MWCQHGPMTFCRAAGRWVTFAFPAAAARSRRISSCWAAKDSRIPGPVDVSDLQVGDAVGDDSGVDPEHQPVGDHDFEVREHRQRSLVEDSCNSSMAEDVDRHADCLSGFAAADRAECG